MSGASSSPATSTSANEAGSDSRQHSHDLGHKKGTTDMFSGMKEYKRAPENSAGEQRRESLKDMSASTTGTLGQMWNNTFRGADGKKEG